MRALILGGYATRPATLLGQMPDVEPKANEVRVRIEAAAFNPLDSKIAIGAMKDWFPISFPYVPGTDFAGVVEAVGSDVSDVAPGDAVFGRADPVRGGALATHVVVAADRVAHRPPSVTAQAAACLPTPAGIALQGLAALGRTDDEPLLILGDGAVAQAAKAMAGHAATIIRSADDFEHAPTTRHVFDAVGGALQRLAIERLPKGSRFVGIVSPVNEETVTRLGLHAEFAVLETSRAQLDEIARLAGRRGVPLRPDRVLALDEAASAFDRYVAHELAGKTIVTGDAA